MAATTWNPADCFLGGTTVFSNGNLTIDRTGSGNWITCRATNGRNTLKRHYEATIGNHIPWSTTGGTQARVMFGLLDATPSITASLYNIGQDTNGRSVDARGATLQCSGLVMPFIPGNGVLVIEVDLVGQKMWFGANSLCTWDPNISFNHNLALVSGVKGLTVERNGGGGNWITVKAPSAGAVKSSGKLHFEITYNSTPGSFVILGGVTAAVDVVNNLVFPGSDTSTGFGYQSQGSTFGMGGITMPSCNSGDVIAFEFDYTNGKGWVQNNSNGLWNNGAIGVQNPATNTGGFTLPAGAFFPSAAFFGSAIQTTLNAGTSAFTVTPSSGFSAYQPTTFLWNNDLIGNQNPASGTGGISTSGIATSTLFPAMSIHDNTNDSTADFDATTFAQSVSSGFTGWDGNQGNIPLSGRGRMPRGLLIR